MPTRPVPRTTVTHVCQAPQAPPDIIIERWLRPAKQLVVIPPSHLDCPPLHNKVILYDAPRQTIIPKVEAFDVTEVDPREYRRIYGSTLVDTMRINDEVSRILRDEHVDENIVSNSTM